MKLIDILEKHKIVISDTWVKGSSIILEDGKFIDLQSSFVNGAIPYRPFRIGIHRDIDKLVYDELKLEGSDLGATQLKYNVIQINDMGLDNEIVKLNILPYIRLPNNKPTDEQLKSLLDWCAHLYDKKINITCKKDTKLYTIEEVTEQKLVDIFNIIYGGQQCLNNKD